MTETELIEWLMKKVRSRPKELKVGIGDDCAVIAVGKKEVLITCDALIENVHFKKGWASWKELGKKASGAALSDIAAMGGRPKFGWAHVSIPKRMKKKEVQEFFLGFLSVFKKFGVTLAGGNINFSPRGFQAATTLWGERPRGVKMLRSSAKPGDGIYIGGPVGLAGRGRKLLEAGSRKQEAGRTRDEGRKFVKAFLNPQPQIALGRWLAKNKIAHACIDVSDGLLQDLGHIANASGVKMVLDRLPFSKSEMTGGEDYILAFTAPPSKEKMLARKKGVKKIGTIF